MEAIREAMHGVFLYHAIKVQYNTCLHLEPVFIYFFYYYFFLTFIYFWDRRRQSMNGGGAEREGDTESETGSRL